MAVVKETAQVDVIVNGTPAKATIKDLEAEYKKLNIQIKNLEIGSEAYVNKSKELQAVGARLKEVRDQVKGVDAETKGMSDRLSKLDGGGGIFSRLKQGFSDTKESISGAVSGLSVFQLGIVGIIAAAAALIGYSLYSYFTKTDEGATKLQGILGGLKAAVERLVAGFVGAGEWIVNAFSKPKEALADIVNFIKSQVEVRIQAVGRMFQALGTMLSGDLKQGFKDLVNAQIDFNTGVENTTGKIAEFGKEIGKAADAAYEMALAVDALEDAERGYSVIQNINKNLIDQLLLQSKNRDLTAQQRIDKLKEAGEIEKQDFEQRLALAQQGLALAKQQNEEDRKKGMDTDEMAQREVDAVNKILQLENESIQLKEKIANREAALRDSIDKDKQQKADQEKKRRDDEQKENEKFVTEQEAFYRKIQDLQISLLTDTYEQKRQMATVASQRELADSKVIGEQRAILEAQIQQKLNLQLSDLDKQFAEQRLKDNLNNVSLASETQEAALQLRYASIIGGEQEYQARLYEIKLSALLQELELLKVSGTAEQDEIQHKENEITRLRAENQKRQTDDAKKSAEDRKKIRDAELSSTKTAVEGLMGLITDLAGENAKATLLYKAFATADVVLNGILEVQRIFASYSTLGPVGQALAVVNAGISIARTGVAVSKIASVQTPQKSGAKGMIVDGPAHGSSYGKGGVGLWNRLTGREIGEIEGGEIVLTKAVATNPTLKSIASRVNQAAGGRAFADGGIVGDDPMSLVNQGSSAVNTLIEQNERMIALQSAQKTTLTAEVSLTEFTEKTTLKDTIDAKANA
jgi:hypothetical protein